MKILHVIPSLGRGGAERQLANLVVSPASGAEHVVYVLHPPDDFAEPIERVGGRVARLELPGGRPWTRGAVAIGRALRRERPDVLQTWLFDANFSSALGRLAAPSVPLVTTLHNLDYEPATIDAAGLPVRKVELLRRIDRALARSRRTTYVACSHSVARSAMTYIGVAPDRLRVIYNSVDPTALVPVSAQRDETRAAVGLPTTGTLVLNVARLDPQKSQDVLLRAFSKVAARDATVHLALAGAGPARAALERLASDLGLGERVTFLGVQPDIGPLYASADIFILPSHFEGFPVALIEAMACGLPAVASRIGPIEEVIDHGRTGILVPAGDADAIATELLRLVDDPGRRLQLAQAGRADVLRRFSTHAVAGQWRDLWTELVAGAGRGASATGIGNLRA